MRQVTAAEWREDVYALVDALHQTHRNLFHSVSPQAFGAAVQALRARIPGLAGHEVVVELARLVAMIGDGHTSLSPEFVPGFHRLPLRLYHFRDGLAVQSIAPAWADAAGMRLVAIDDTPAIDAYELVRPLVSCDNPIWVRGVAPALLSVPEILHACGVTRNPDRATLTLHAADGTAHTLALAAVEDYPEVMVDAAAGAPRPLPLWRREPPATNWCAALGEHRAVYAQYSLVRDTPEERTAAFFERIMALAGEDQAERLVLDIRQNSGGNLWLNQPLIHQLIRNDKINVWGHLYVIIGRWTFSAGMALAAALERHTRALFVGEPTGSRPNAFGETNTITLPHSKITASCSSLWWQCSDPIDDRRWIAPEVPAPLTLEAYRENRDPALDTALTHAVDMATIAEFPARLARQLRRRDLLPV